MGEYRRLVPQGRFRFSNENENEADDDFSAILKTIVALEDYDDVNSSEAQLQSSSQVLSDELSIVQRSKRGYM